VLPEGGYQFRRDASLQVSRYESPVAFSIPSATGGLNICLNPLSQRAPKSNSLADVLRLNNKTVSTIKFQTLATARRIFLLAASSGLTQLRCKTQLQNAYG
jgi:hypothetical protein